MNNAQGEQATKDRPPETINDGIITLNIQHRPTDNVTGIECVEPYEDAELPSPATTWVL